MPNTIKYSTSAQTLALKEGNFWIGTGDVGKGPTPNTEFWNGITPPVGGYTIYLGRVGQGPSIYAVDSDTLISLTNTFSGGSFTTVDQCLSWYLTQPDKMVVNIDYEPIATNGLVLNLDAGFVPSYPRTGTTWYDISGSNNATFEGSTTFTTSTNSGSFVFDGSNSVVWGVNGAITPFLDSWWNLGSKTFEMWVNFSNVDGFKTLFSAQSISESSESSYNFWSGRLGMNGLEPAGSRRLSKNTWYHIVWVSNSASHSLYLNGGYMGLVSGYMGGTDMVNDFTVKMMGKTLQQSGNYAQGSVPIFRLYNRALSVAEAYKNYISMIPRVYTFPDIIQSGLVLNLDASLAPTSTWLDLSGNGNNATLLNGAVFNSSSGGGIVFDGVNDYCSTSLSKTFTSMTIQVWFYGDGNQTQFAGLVANRTSTSLDATGLLLNNFNNQSLGYNWNNSPSTYSWNSGLKLNYYGWHFLSISVSPTVAVAFLNGVTASNTISHTPATLTQLDIGRDPNQVRWLNGRISSVYIYDRALSNVEVLQNYNTTLGRYSSFPQFISYRVWEPCIDFFVFLLSGGFTVGNTVYSDGEFTVAANKTFTQIDLFSVYDYENTNTGITTNSLGVITAINVPIQGCYITGGD